MLHYVLDEHVAPALAHGLRRRVSGLVVWNIGDPGTPPRGTLDPDVLIWCEEHNHVLATNNRSSMPRHLADHLAAGRHVPGIFVLRDSMGLGEMIEQLVLGAIASMPDEYRDQIRHLPF